MIRITRGGSAFAPCHPRAGVARRCSAWCRRPSRAAIVIDCDIRPSRPDLMACDLLQIQIDSPGVRQKGIDISPGYESRVVAEREHLWRQGSSGFCERPLTPRVGCPLAAEREA